MVLGFADRTAFLTSHSQKLVDQELWIESEEQAVIHSRVFVNVQTKNLQNLP